MTGLLIPELIILLGLILVHGFLAASEIAIVSARRNLLQEQADSGEQGAQRALRLIQDSDRFLATMQFAMTLLSTLVAAFAGLRIGGALIEWFSSMPLLRPYAAGLALASVVVLVGYLSLVIGQLTPKRLAIQHAERMASIAAPPMTLLASVARPVVALLTASVNLLLGLLRQQRTHKTTVTAEDIVHLAHEGAASGTVETEQLQLIQRVFEFSDRPVRAAMTPRTEITALPADAPLSVAMQTFLSTGYSRLPVYGESLDQILGVLYAKDLLDLVRIEQDLPVAQRVRAPTFVLEYQHVNDLLSTFRRQGSHLALVVDEYGQVTGLITLEDVLEELVGEIQDEYDPPNEATFVQRHDGSWLVDAMEAYDTVAERLDLPAIPEEERGAYTTLAGLILARLGRIPGVGDIVVMEDAVLEVVDMDGRRIDKILIRRSVDEAPFDEQGAG